MNVSHNLYNLPNINPSPLRDIPEQVGIVEDEVGVDKPMARTQEELEACTSSLLSKVRADDYLINKLELDPHYSVFEDYSDFIQSAQFKRAEALLEPNFLENLLKIIPYELLFEKNPQFSIAETTTKSTIYIPLEGAQRQLALVYKEKYGIDIQVATFSDFAAEIKKLSCIIKKPTYIGIIVSHCIDLHQTPVLCYFDGRQRSANEYLVADSLSDCNSWYRDRVVKELEKVSHHHGKRIFYTQRDRQADGFSCHTDVLVFLRNALLDLVKNERKEGFDAALKAGSVSQNAQGKFEIEHLPPLWDYGSQISNKREDRGEDRVAKTPLIRTLYTPNREKKSQVMTVESFRKKIGREEATKKTTHLQILFKTPFNINSIFYSSRTTDLLSKDQCEQLGSLSSSEVSVKCERDCLSIVYHREFMRNDYLAQKSEKTYQKIFKNR